MKNLIPFLLLLTLIAGCSGKKKEIENSDDGVSEKSKNTSSLPEAAGAPGEVVLVINKKKYDGTLGDAIKEVFQAPVPGLTRTEPMFILRVVEPSEFNRIFKLAGNLVYVVSFQGDAAADKWLQGTFSETSRERIFNNPELFMQTSQNQFAKGQKVLQLFGKDDVTLIKNLKEKKHLIQNYFNIAEKERLSKSIRMSSQSRSILKKVKKKLNINIKIPADYELAILEDDFAWVRTLPAAGPSKNLFIYRKSYVSQDEFEPENVIKLRNKIGKKYIYGDPDNHQSFMTTETKYVKPVLRNINFKNQFTVEMKGAWKTNNLSVGGTFVSYTFVDKGTKDLYYIEGFVIHPNEEHRNLIREMESLLTTFSIIR